MLKLLKEPSTYAGFAAVIAGIGQIAQINEAPAIADAINNAAQPIINQDWIGAAMVFLGSIAIFLKEKGLK